MKKIFIFVFVLVIIFSAISCAENKSPEHLITQFLSAYGAEGVVYSPARREWEEGYINDEMFGKIFVSYGAFSGDFAIFLNSRTDSRAECGAFVCDGAGQSSDVYEMCAERLRLLGAGDNGFILRAGGVIFYSSMPDRVRAEKIWRNVIG